MNDIKLVALDFDGVLNNSSEAMSNGYYNLHPEMMKRLNKIIDLTTSERCPTKIVLSTTWRHEFGCFTGINMFFEAVGIRPVCIGKTESFQGHERGIEILEFIMRHQLVHNINVKHLCILDDDMDMGPMMPWLVNTVNKIGITDEDIAHAVQMLNKPFKLEWKLNE